MTFCSPLRALRKIAWPFIVASFAAWQAIRVKFACMDCHADKISLDDSTTANFSVKVARKS